ncbi:LysM peptidoglycan-binding domain-containing protein [Rossellomorea aquimaris]|uniref:LysM peptidoglycan-binding domain-containing protein n=1 Tax=Bacillaceae TaxID=186817 RepID=UPI0011ED9AC2|nr:LysM peptidoglycan-binding domain-containing protein [Bacillus sp. CH30_1T]KAA0562751.1 LysM peptidoglycan-binding domain-containing protein [Bacillus sp. CH30_1T]
MSKDPYRDQAARLKQKIERAPEKAPLKKREPLPARSEVHREKKKKNKWRMKYPLISMLLLFFILLPLTVFSIYSYFDSRNGPLVVMSEDVDDVEEVRYDQSDNGNEESLGDAGSIEEEAAVIDKKEESMNEDAASMTGKEQPASTEPASPSPEQESAEEKPKEEVNEEPVEEQPAYKIVYHTVAPQETLYRIAMKYYNSQSGVERIKEWNNIHNNEIQSGQVLEIPLDQ